MALTIEEARSKVGEKVVYRPHGGDPEDGTITSVNDRYVFVSYDGGPAKATSPADLELLTPTVPKAALEVRVGDRLWLTPPGMDAFEAVVEKHFGWGMVHNVFEVGVRKAGTDDLFRLSLGVDETVMEVR